MQILLTYEPDVPKGKEDEYSARATQPHTYVPIDTHRQCWYGAEPWGVASGDDAVGARALFELGVRALPCALSRRTAGKVSFLVPGGVSRGAPAPRGA